MKKVVITQSIEQTKDFVTLLNQIKMEVVVFPVIKVVPLPITQNLKQVFSHLENYDWIVFNSINSVRYFFYILMNQFLKFPRNKPQIACLGQKTVDTLRTYSKQANYKQKDFSASDFYQLFLKDNKIEDNSKILIPLSSEEMNSDDYSSKSRCDCHFLPIYETKINNFIPPQQIEQIKNSEDLIITFFNPLAVENFFKIIPASEFNPNWYIIAGGKETANALKELNTGTVIIAKEAKSDLIYEEIKKLEIG